jgi:hypothetical protein
VIAIERAGLALAALERYKEPTKRSFSQIKRVGSSLREGVSWSEELSKVCVLSLDKILVQSHRNDDESRILGSGECSDSGGSPTAKKVDASWGAIGAG